MQSPHLHPSPHLVQPTRSHGGAKRWGGGGGEGLVDYVYVCILVWDNVSGGVRLCIYVWFGLGVVA